MRWLPRSPRLSQYQYFVQLLDKFKVPGISFFPQSQVSSWRIRGITPGLVPSPSRASQSLFHTELVSPYELILLLKTWNCSEPGWRNPPNANYQKSGRIFSECMPCRVSWLVNDLTAVDWPAKRVGVVGIPSLVGAQSPVILLTFPVKTGLRFLSTQHFPIHLIVIFVAVMLSQHVLMLS